MNPRVLVIGLDGATFEVLRPLADAGYLPFLGRLMADGVARPLRSIIPPTTAPAWTSFQTGKNPGKHGVIDFTDFDKRRRQSTLVTAGSIRATPFWQLIGAAGLRVGVINVPMTYPPAPVNGVLMAGLFTPDVQSTFTFPATLYEEVRRAVGDYQLPLLATAVFTLGQEAFLEEAARRASLRARAARYLMQSRPWAFFMVHFQSLDSVQHMFWATLERRLLQSKPPVSPVEARLVAYFQTIDENVRELVDAAGSGATVLVASDHGFGPMTRHVYVNEWLRRNGWLASRVGTGQLAAMATAERVLRALDVFKLRRHLKLRKQRFAALRRINQEMLIDWEHSRAFAMACSHTAHVYINPVIGNGRAYAHTREMIRAALAVWKDPATGALVFPQVYRREEIFSGPYVERLPDLVGVPAPGYHVATRFRGGRLFDPADGGLTGDHRPDGVLIATGPGIRRGALPLLNPRLIDLAPTILYVLGVPVPKDMDGRILEDLLDPALLQQRPPEYATAPEEALAAAAVGATLSEQESERMREHLRGLGYL